MKPVVLTGRKRRMPYRVPRGRDLVDRVAGVGRPIAALVVLAIVLSEGSAAVSAWEIELKPQRSVRAALVYLEDVASITGLSPERTTTIGRIPLMPGPTAARPRLLRAADLRQALLRRGVDLAECRFTGSTRVLVQWSAQASRTPTQHPESSLPNTGSQAETAVSQALSKRVAEHNNSTDQWTVRLSIPRGRWRTLPSQWDAVQVAAIDVPESGRHETVAEFHAGDQIIPIPIEFWLDHAVRLPVTRRPIPAGTIIEQADVTFDNGVTEQRAANSVRRMEDLVGWQTKSALPAGKPISLKTLQRPLLIHRRDEVTVTATSPGIRVRKRVIALDDGAKGDMIMVQDPGDRHDRFPVRVVGPQMAEVAVSPPLVDSARRPIGRN